MARIPPSAARWQRRSPRQRRRAGIDRTRLLFFILLAIFLVILGSALVGRVVDSNFLTQLFIAATIFSLGVLVIDFLGLLGSHDHGAADHADAATHLESDHTLDHADWLEHDGDADHGGFHDLDHTGEALDAQSDGGDASPHGADVAILTWIKYMRWSVYFCLGFGPVGWISMAAGRSAGWALVVAALAGFASVALAQVFFRFRPGDTGMVPAPEEMLWEQATVTIPLSHTRLGRVRVTQGLTVQEPFALAAAEGVEFRTGDHVRIVRVTDACVYVE
jgi:hypothetical protein